MRSGTTGLCLVVCLLFSASSLVSSSNGMWTQSTLAPSRTRNVLATEGQWQQKMAAAVHHQVNARIHLNATASESPVTIVTALFDIGRGEISQSTRTMDEYRDWFSHTLRIRNPMIIFVGSDELKQWVLKRRYGLLTLVIVTPVENIPYYDLRTAVSTLLKNDKFQPSHRAYPEYTLPLYIPVMYSKFEWLKAAVTHNPFNSQYFFWIDAGGGRWTAAAEGKHWPDMDRLFEVIPAMKDATKPKIALQKSMWWPKNNEKKTRDEALTGIPNYCVGTMFGGTGPGVLRLAKLAQIFTIETTASAQLGPEQTFLYVANLEHPELFHIISDKCPERGCAPNRDPNGGNFLTLLDWLSEKYEH